VLKTLPTFNGRSKFKYTWTDDDKIELHYGTEFQHEFSIDGIVYDELIQAFKGKTVKLNHKRNEKNIEDWLINKGIEKPGITSYLGSILDYEKHARKGTKRGTIKRGTITF
jgi:phosphoenolpyruvate synthase/pyruvate phosphate dikinase